jgi:hypothetical protein
LKPRDFRRPRARSNYRKIGIRRCPIVNPIATHLAALGESVGLLVLVGTHAEVLVGLTGSLDTAEQDSVGTGGGTDGELVEGNGLTASSDDALLGATSESEGGNGELGDLGQADVIGDSSNLDDDLGVTIGGSSSFLDDS